VIGLPHHLYFLGKIEYPISSKYVNVLPYHVLIKMGGCRLSTTVYIHVVETQKDILMFDIIDDNEVISSIDTLLDNVFIDPVFNNEELSLLNMEITPEIEAILINHVYAVATKEANEFARTRAVNTSVDNERLLAQVIDIQEQMATIMKRIHNTEDSRQVSLSQLDNWVKRFNTWKDSPAYTKVSYQERNRAWTIYKSKLADLKSAYHGNKGQVSHLWETWKTLKEDCTNLIGSRSYIWGMYFGLIAETISPYITNGDTEEVDNSTIFNEYCDKTISCIRDEHIKEELSATHGATHGRGFWNTMNERMINNNGCFAPINNDVIPF
jgi:hypothetical protein